MASIDITNGVDNSAQKHLKQYAQMVSGLLSESELIVEFGDYAGMTFSQIYSDDYVYCRQLLRNKPKTINMLQFQGYIQKMNFIYKPDVQQMCENYASMKNSASKIKAIKN
tara:strand:- start:922 stop:1254 length:333 start_codon:yes stop_codon:yes gene_type:complete